MANKTKHIIEMTALDKTKAGFDKVKRGLGTVKNAAAGVTKVIAGTAVAFAAVATTLAVVAKKSFDFADAIGKVSTRTGIATDTIQAFQIAAVLAGGEIDGANTSLEKFGRSVGDAQRGLKTQTDIFKDLGVSIVDVNGVTKDLDVLLREVTQAIGELDSQSAKATVAANLFGRQGIKLLGAIDSLGMSLDQFIDRAKEYNLILDTESIKKSELFNDTLFILSRQFKILTAEIAIAFLPILQTLTAGMVDNTKEFTNAQGGAKTFGETIRDSVLAGMVAGIRGFATFLDALHDARRDLKQFSIDVRREFYETELSILEFRKSMDVFGFGTDRFNIFIDIAKQKIAMLNNEMFIFDGTTSSAGDSVRETADNLEAFFKKIIDGDPETQKLIDNLLGVGGAFNKANNSLTSIQKPLEVFESQLNDEEEQIKAFQTATVNAFKGAENALTNFVMKGELDFKGFVNALIADMVRLAIRQRIIAPLFNMFGDGTFNMFSNFANPVSSNTPTPPAMKGAFPFEGGGFTGFGNRTGGLDGKGGFPAILHPNETVIDHHKGQQVAQQAVNVNFSIQATDASGFDEMLTARKNQIVAMISQAMNQKGKVGLI